MTSFSWFSGNRLSSKKCMGPPPKRERCDGAIVGADSFPGFTDWDIRISFWEIPDMPYLVRSQVLTGYATLARALGLAPELLARSVGLDLSALADLDARISAKAFAELL